MPRFRRHDLGTVLYFTLSISPPLTLDSLSQSLTMWKVFFFWWVSWLGSSTGTAASCFLLLKRWRTEMTNHDVWALSWRRTFLLALTCRRKKLEEECDPALFVALSKKRVREVSRFLSWKTLLFIALLRRKEERTERSWPYEHEKLVPRKASLP